METDDAPASTEAIVDLEAPAASPVPAAPAATYTPVAAYAAMKADKLINASQLLVCDVLSKATEPMTRMEIAQQVKEDGHEVSASGIGSRTGELVGLGVLRERPKRRCRVSEITVATFEMTGKLPAKDLAPVRFTRRQLLRALAVGYNAAVYVRLPLIITNIAKELGIEEPAVASTLTENIAACNAQPSVAAEGEDKAEGKPARRKKGAAAEEAPTAKDPAAAPAGPPDGPAAAPKASGQDVEPEDLAAHL